VSVAKLTNIENAISVRKKDRVISESISESGETVKEGLSPLSREDFNAVTKSKTNPTKRKMMILLFLKNYVVPQLILEQQFFEKLSEFAKRNFSLFYSTRPLLQRVL